ncbi:HGGxSTG domain-containing protein [Sphingomonas floccifaciens]|uniref:HGGxSTG domain-containing protein n=1 Tax=Sphingomonas floccifaciens TaxID=1844115 RepID=A0ABW4NHS6_9SPHN
MTRQGTACLSPAMRGKRRCRLHGGKSKGAPIGNRNAVKHGMRTADLRLFRRMMRSIVVAGRAVADDIG